MQGRCNGRARVSPCSALPRCSVEARGPLSFSVHLPRHLPFFPPSLLPLKMAFNDSMRVHLRKPAQYPINPLSHFNNLKMIRAWLMTALVSLRELRGRPWESFHLRDLPSVVTQTSSPQQLGGLPVAHYSHPSGTRGQLGEVGREIVVFFSLQGATSLHKDSFSQQAKMTWKFDSARVTNYTFSREKYYLIETSFYPAEKLYCAAGIVSYYSCESRAKAVQLSSAHQKGCWNRG